MYITCDNEVRANGRPVTSNVHHSLCQDIQNCLCCLFWNIHLSTVRHTYPAVLQNSRSYSFYPITHLWPDGFFFFLGGTGDQTQDPPLAKQAIKQLSYLPGPPDNFDEGFRTVPCGKQCLFNEGTEKTGYPCKSEKPKLYLTLYTKINYKWVKYLNVNAKPVKILEANTESFIMLGLVKIS